MKSLKLKKLIAVAVVAVTMATLSPIGASAEWKQDSKGWWNTEGNSYSTGWRFINGSWYNFGQDGYMKTGWVKDGSTWYYLQPSGAMKTGWINDGGTWYYLAQSGAMKTGWVNDGDTWYYLAQSGAMKTGWINDNGVWYFAASSGAMQTGVIEVEGKIYYLASSGAMQKGNVTIDGVIYTFASSGEAIGNKIPTPVSKFTSSGIVKKPSSTDVDESEDSNVSSSSGGSSGSSLSNLSDGKTHNKNYTIYISGIFGSSDSSKVTTINGDVSISKTNASTSDSVTLRNMNITGTLTIDFGDGDVILDNVTVNGVNVSNVGANSLHIKGKSTLKNLNVNDKNGNAHIVLEGNVVIENTKVNAGAQFEVGSDAILYTIAADSDFTISGAGQINNVIVEKAGIKVELKVTSQIGTILVNKEASEAIIDISNATIVINLNVNAPIKVNGNGQIVTANLGVSGVTIVMKPTIVGVLSGVTANVGGKTVSEGNGAIKIDKVPTELTPETDISEFQKEINKKYTDYAGFKIDGIKEDDKVTFTVDFAKDINNNETGEDYVSRNFFVTNAEGTDEGITYDDGKYTVPVGSRVYAVVRVYRDGQIGYVTTLPVAIN